MTKKIYSVSGVVTMRGKRKITHPFHYDLIKARGKTIEKSIGELLKKDFSTYESFHINGMYLLKTV
jgi:hypothetical protein